MEQNSLISLVTSFFSSPKSTGSVYQDSVVVKPVDDGLTGVARYLGEKPAVSSVTAYLENLQNLAEDENETGVSKYLAAIEKQEVAAAIIAKYLEDQEALKAQKEQEALEKQGTSVTRYLRGLSPETEVEEELEVVVQTGVSKYLEAQDEILRQQEEQRAIELAELEKLKAAKLAKQEEKKAARLAEREKYLERWKQELQAWEQIDRNKAEQKTIGQINLDVKESAVPETVIAESLVEPVVDDTPPTTRVEEYLNKNNASVSGVARYLAQQEVKPKASSVTKYLVNKKVKDVDLTGVDKYMVEKSKIPETSSVTRYLINQELDKIKNTKTVSKVEKYLQQEALQASKLEAEKIIAKYLEEQRMLFKKRAIEAEKAELEQALALAEAQKTADVAAGLDESATSVSRYIAQQEILNQDKPIATGVDRYIAKQLIANSNKPELTGVAKFVAEQEIAEKANEAKTGVEKYLRDREKDEILHPVEVVTESSVSKYIDSHKDEPAVSGVEKYLVQKEKARAADEAAV